MPVHIDGDICKGCGLCVYYCPMDVLEMGDQMNRKGFTVARVETPKACTECKLCELNCPDLAIYVEEAEKAKTG
ncbi:MAG: 4Fe-4S dicluster domain-containing protein [Bacillota bacterium]